MWATVEEIKERWPEEEEGPIPATDNRIGILIEDAEDTVLREFPDVPNRIDAGTLPERRVVKVVARMVQRYLLNQSGVRSQTSGAGPFQQTITFGGDDPGALTLSDEDRRDLTSGGSKAFSIDTTPAHYNAAEPDLWHEVWWSA